MFNATIVFLAIGASDVDVKVALELAKATLSKSEAEIYQEKVEEAKKSKKNLIIWVNNKNHKLRHSFPEYVNVDRTSYPEFEYKRGVVVGLFKDGDFVRQDLGQESVIGLREVFSTFPRQSSFMSFTPIYVPQVQSYVPPTPVYTPQAQSYVPPTPSYTPSYTPSIRASYSSRSC